MKKVVLIMTASLCLLMFYLCSLKKEHQKNAPDKPQKKVKSHLITRAEYGERYPFKLDSLTVFCKSGRIIVWEKGTSNVWAVNGAALMAAPKFGWKPVKDAAIWNKKDLGLVLTVGRDLCN